MEIRIQSIHFDATERLQAFINKKVERMGRHNAEISAVAVTLKVVKPETAMNKEAVIKVTVPGNDDMVASKVADTFEEAVDVCVDALQRQLEKYKDKK